jgi:glutamine cyclotransferase
VDKDNANVMKKVNMDKKYFAEGLTYYKDTLVQITWKSKQGFVYNITNLEEISNFTFTTTVNQGWGITWDRCKDELIVTDGSENIHFWDPQTMKEKRRISVKRLDSTLAKEMNEIEFWRGRILANVWYEDVMLVINPETGVVEKEYGKYK